LRRPADSDIIFQTWGKEGKAMRMKSGTGLIVFLFLGFTLVLNSRAIAQTLTDPLERIVLAKLGRPAAPYRKQYDFHADWDYFTYNIPIWEVALSSYQGQPNIHYLEIGVLEGRSAVWMLENVLTHPTSTLTGIDIFHDHKQDNGQTIKQRFLSNVKEAGGEGRTTLIEGYSQVELRKLPLDSFDLIYIDGSHATADVLEDTVLSWRLLKKGGLMIFDDYGPQFYQGQPNEERPILAINAFVILNRNSLNLIHCDYQVIIRKRVTKP
jgi:predicted O-methyltransferase YrrM